MKAFLVAFALIAAVSADVSHLQGYDYRKPQTQFVEKHVSPTVPLPPNPVQQQNLPPNPVQQQYLPPNPVQQQYLPPNPVQQQYLPPVHYQPATEGQYQPTQQVRYDSTQLVNLQPSSAQVYHPDPVVVIHHQPAPQLFYRPATQVHFQSSQLVDHQSAVADVYQPAPQPNLPQALQPPVYHQYPVVLNQWDAVQAQNYLPPADVAIKHHQSTAPKVRQNYVPPVVPQRQGIVPATEFSEGTGYSYPVPSA